MKIISWNCNGKFREKFKEIIKFDADVYVIQECEDPEKYLNDNYPNFAKNSVWIGDNPNKGLGVFAKQEILIEHNISENTFTGVEDVLSAVEDGLVEKGNNRWYDLDKTVRTAINMLENSPLPVQKAVAKEMAKMVVDKIKEDVDEKDDEQEDE